MIFMIKVCFVFILLSSSNLRIGWGNAANGFFLDLLDAQLLGRSSPTFTCVFYSSRKVTTEPPAVKSGKPSLRRSERLAARKA